MKPWNTEVHHQNQLCDNNWSSSFNSAALLTGEKGKKTISIKINQASTLPRTSDHGSGLCWVDLTLRSEILPSQESEEEKVDLISLNV